MLAGSANGDEVGLGDGESENGDGDSGAVIFVGSEKGDEGTAVRGVSGCEEMMMVFWVEKVIEVTVSDCSRSCCCCCCCCKSACATGEVGGNTGVAEVVRVGRGGLATAGVVGRGGSAAAPFEETGEGTVTVSSENGSLLPLPLPSDESDVTLGDDNDGALVKICALRRLIFLTLVVVAVWYAAPDGLDGEIGDIGASLLFTSCTLALSVFFAKLVCRCKFVLPEEEAACTDGSEEEVSVRNCRNNTGCATL